MRHILLTVLGLNIALGLLAAGNASAIPAFARRYETSCQTCHVAYPRLTPFGEAFRRNGYRFPGGGDAMAQKQEPVALGNEVMKERWPKAVWPGELPAALPLSMQLNGQAAWGGGHADAAGGHGAAAEPAAASEHGSSQLNVGSLAGDVGLRAAGTLGDAAALFISVNMGGHAAIEVERSFALLTPWSPTAFQVKLGRFEPALHGVSVHRSLFPHQQALTTTPIGLNPFTPEMAVNGLELGGVAVGRFGWALGAVENATPGVFNRKDLYGRAEYKLGGMRLDGVDAQAGEAAWSERSLLIGLSGWMGQAALTNLGKHLRNDQVLRIGADLHAVFDNWLLDAVLARQTHSGPLLLDGAVTADLLSAELTWMVHAFAFPSLRIDATMQEGGPTHGTGWTASALVTTVVRPNLVMRLQGAFGTEPGSHAEFQSAALSFSAAY